MIKEINMVLVPGHFFDITVQVGEVGVKIIDPELGSGEQGFLGHDGEAHIIIPEVNIAENGQGDK